MASISLILRNLAL